MGKPVKDTVVGESPLWGVGETNKEYSYTPAKKVRGLAIAVVAWGANKTADSALTVDGANTTSLESNIGSAAPYPWSEWRFIDLGSEKSGPFALKVTKDTNVNLRLVVVGLRSGSAITASEAKGSASASTTSRSVGAQTWPGSGGALGLFVLTLGPNLPTSRSGTLLLQKDEGENSWDVQYNERESTSANENWSWTGACPASCTGVLFTGSSPATGTVEGEAEGTGEATGVAEGSRITSGEAAGTGSATGAAEGVAVHSGEAAGSGSATGSAEGEVSKPVAEKTKTRRKPDLALDIEVETPDGVFRLPADSRKARNLPRNLSFGTARGEGFSIGGLNLSREIFKRYPDIGLLDTWRAISHTGKIAYEGRLQSNPRTNDPEELIEIALIGWASYLAGKKIKPLILDSRLSSFEEPSLQRKQQLVEAGFNLSKMGVSTGWQGEAAGPNEAAIVFTPADWVNPKFRAEQWFDGHGESIEKVLYNFLVLVAGGMAEFLVNAAVISTTDTAGSVTEGTNHRTTAASNQSVTRSAGDGKYAYIKSLREGGAYAGQSTGDSWAFAALKVIGAHGLTLQGTWPEVGFYLTDIIRYILATYFPKVSLAGEANDFIVQQASWHDSPQLGFDILKQLNNLALWELNMWENRTLYHEPADLTRFDWRFKTTDPGVRVKFQGDSIENFANGCSVQYTDFDGVSHFLSPNEHPELLDESEDNPANRHGEDLWTDCDVPYQCNEAEALQFGRVYLAEYNRPKRPGSYEIEGHIEDFARNWHAGWEPRNGETVGIMDLFDDEPRLITSTQWDDVAKVLTLTVDAPDKLLDAIVARQQIARETRGL